MHEPNNGYYLQGKRIQKPSGLAGNMQFIPSHKNMKTLTPMENSGRFMSGVTGL